MTSENKSDVTALMAVRSSDWLDAIHCGDNCEIMRQMQSESVDLVVTSPPYDDLRTYGGHGWDFYGVAWNLKRILKPGGVIVWVVNDATVDGSETGSSMEQALHFKRIGLNLHDTMVWHKTNAMPLNNSRYEPAWEYIFVLSKGKPAAWNPAKDRSLLAGVKSGGTQIDADGTRKPKWGNGTPYNEMKVKQNVLPFPVGGGDTGHPAVFPDDLAKLCVSTWSNPGGVVLDCFAGSGTTLKAAKELNRRFIGIEVNPEYVEIINKRIAQDALALGV